MARMGEEEVKLTKQQLGWPLEPPSLVPQRVEQHCRQAMDRGRQAEADWNATVSAYGKHYPEASGPSSDDREMTVDEAVEVWRNEEILTNARWNCRESCGVCLEEQLTKALRESGHPLWKE